MKHEKTVLDLLTPQFRYVAVVNVYDDKPFDWACYQGKKTDSVEHVQYHGDKILAELARTYFPNLTDIPYRH